MLFLVVSKAMEGNIEGSEENRPMNSESTNEIDLKMLIFISHNTKKRLEFVAPCNVLKGSRALNFLTSN